MVERAQLEFGPGLNALTGETGAGKSIVLGALALLAGARASADVVREGAEEALVEAVFRTDAAPELEASPARARHRESRTTRSWSRAACSRADAAAPGSAGALVPVSALAELLAERLEISSQHESQGLRRPESHGRLLDAFGGLLALRERVGPGYTALRERWPSATRLERRGRRARAPARLPLLPAGRDRRRRAAARRDRGARRRARAARARRASCAARRAPRRRPLAPATRTAARSIASRPRRARLDALVAKDASLAPLVERLRSAATGALRRRARSRALRRSRRTSDPGAARRGRGAARDDRAAAPQVRPRGGRGAGASATRSRRSSPRSGAAMRARASSRRRRSDCARSSWPTPTALSAGRREAGARLAREVSESLKKLDLPHARLAVALEPVERARRDAVRRRRAPRRSSSASAPTRARRRARCAAWRRAASSRACSSR